MMFFNNKDEQKITGILVRILFLSVLVLGAAQRAEAAAWTPINGRVLTQTGEPVCAMVLANGQHMFSCDGSANYSLDVPLDSNNLITLQVFATGFAPFSQTLSAGEAVDNNVIMERDTTGNAFTITHNVSTPLPNGWKTVSGTISHQGVPLCAMILINGQSMFSCDQSLGQYSLEVPLDGNGHITLQAFVAGFMPYRNTLEVNDPPVATGQCDTTFQADTYSGALKATDPDSAMLTYALIYPADGSAAGNGPITTFKGGSVEITDPTGGDYIYTPGTAAGDRRGWDSFQYRVSDPGGLSQMATEVVIVNQTIMPLGDSITSGTGSTPFIKTEQTGYRRTLQDNLTTTGYTFDFVGGDSQGIAAVPAFDYNNEGHGGWTAAELRDGGGENGDPTDGTDAGTFGWLEANPADIILLHAGTNGLKLGTSDSIASDVAGMNSILSKIRLWEDSASGNPVTIVLAHIIDQVPNDPAVTAFNEELHQLALDRIQQEGYDIIEVNMQTGAGLSYEVGVDMFDKLHPNDSGYNKMADAWFSALDNVIDRCP